MPAKRFRTRRQWSNSRLWALTGTIIVLSAGTITAMTGQSLVLQMGLGLALAGAVLAYRNDRVGKVSYVLDQDTLMLKRNGVLEQLQVTAIRDASLVDRRAARDLIMGAMVELEASGRSKQEARALRDKALRYCTVDIGMNSLTFGFGRHLIDQRPDAKHDLVLLRKVDGTVLVLSPVYNQDMVESLNRYLHVVPLEGYRNRA
jgi:hypothetical protein